MGEITLEHDSEEWTPEFLMELGKEWIKEATLEQTLQKGLQKGEASMLLTFLEECFGTLPTWAIEKVQAADHSTKEMWMRRAAKAQSLKEIFMD